MNMHTTDSAILPLKKKLFENLPYFSDYKSTRCISRPLFFSCKMIIFSDTLSIRRLPQSLFFTYNCMNSYKIIDHIKSDKTKSKKLFQYSFNFLLKTWNSHI